MLVDMRDKDGIVFTVGVLNQVAESNAAVFNTLTPNSTLFVAFAIHRPGSPGVVCWCPDSLVAASFEQSINMLDMLWIPQVGCWGCGEHGVMMDCKQCKHGHYCSRNCQVSDLPNHKPYCKGTNTK